MRGGLEALGRGGLAAWLLSRLAAYSPAVILLTLPHVAYAAGFAEGLEAAVDQAPGFTAGTGEWGGERVEVGGVAGVAVDVVGEP